MTSGISLCSPKETDGIAESIDSGMHAGGVRFNEVSICLRRQGFRGGDSL